MTKTEMKTEMKERRRAAIAKLDAEIAIAEGLPEDLEASPTISNIATGGMRCWLSFNNNTTAEAIDILRTLDRDGFETSAATLCKYGSYRRAPVAGLLEGIPDERHRATLTDSEPIAPLWVVPNQFTGPEAVCFLSKGGDLYHVTVNLSCEVYTTATRTERMGEWNYKKGTARISFPSEWHSNSRATVAAHSGAWLNPGRNGYDSQSTGGAVYFTPHDDQSSWKTSAGDFLAELIESV